MRVDSYPELFTTLFGWQFYGMIWDVMATLGLVFIPFIVIVVRNWMEPAKDPGYRSAWSRSLAGMEIEFYLAVFVAALAGAPAMTLNASALAYQAPATYASPSTTATVATPASSYGGPGAFAGAPGAVQIPVWWYTVLTLSKGLNHAIMEGLPDESGLREIRRQAELASIPDPAVRREAAQFYNDCYVTARARYSAEPPSSAAVAAALSTYGEADTEWMGSHVFRDLYYPNLRARQRVPGWPYSAARDRDYNPADPNQTGGWGQPTCSQWWSNPTRGVRAKIIAASPENSSLQAKLGNIQSELVSLGFPGFAAAAEKSRDTVARKALDSARVGTSRDFQGDDYGGVDRDFIGRAESTSLLDILGASGAASTRATTEIKLETVRPALPLAQALILMAIYMLLPFVVVFSSYSLGAMIIGGIAIFTVNFWSVLWKIGQWADENLMAAMHPGTGESFMAFLVSDSNWAQATSKAFIADTMLALFMFGLPLLFSVMMAWAGVRALGTLTQSVLADAQRPADSAGRTGAGHVSKGVSFATGPKGAAGAAAKAVARK